MLDESIFENTEGNNKESKTLVLENAPSNPNDPEKDLVELKKALWCFAGVVSQYRLLEQDILAKVRVSGAMKQFAMEDADPNKPLAPVNFGLFKQMEGLMKDLRDGAYLILKLNGGPCHLLGKGHADGINEPTLDRIYAEIDSVSKFFKVSERVEQFIKMKKERNCSEK